MKSKLAGHKYSWSIWWYICGAALVYYKYGDCVFSTEGKEHKTGTASCLKVNEHEFSTCETKLDMTSAKWKDLHLHFCPAMARCLVFSMAEKKD